MQAPLFFRRNFIGPASKTMFRFRVKLLTNENFEKKSNRMGVRLRIRVIQYVNSKSSSATKEKIERHECSDYT